MMHHHVGFLVILLSFITLLLKFFTPQVRLH